jgi:hypothetical protein
MERVGLATAMIARRDQASLALGPREMKRQGPSCRGEGSAHRTALALGLNSLGVRKGGLVASASGGFEKGLG